MKATIKSETKEFGPIKIELVIETVEELRSIYHIANHTCPIKILLDDSKYNYGYGEAYADDPLDLLRNDLSEILTDLDIKI